MAIGTKRLHILPAFEFVGNTGTAVAWFKKGEYFIINFEPYKKDGQAYPGYLAAWYLNEQIFPTKLEAKTVALEWLGTSLI